MSLITDVKKIYKNSYLINNEVKLIINKDGTVNAHFNDISNTEVDEIINEFFEKPIEDFEGNLDWYYHKNML